jgi:hypothetical protein
MNSLYSMSFMHRLSEFYSTESTDDWAATALATAVDKSGGKIQSCSFLRPATRLHPRNRAGCVLVAVAAPIEKPFGIIAFGRPCSSP